MNKHFKYPAPPPRKRLFPTDPVPSAPATPRTIFLRLGDRLALGADSSQWILYLPRRSPAPAFDARLTAKDWFPIAFISSTKAVLERCIVESAASLTAGGRSALERLPDTFDAWKGALSAPAAVPTPVLAEAIDG